MARPFKTVRSANPTADTSIVTTSETTVATLPAVSTQGASGTVDVLAIVSMTAGTGTTAIVVRIRRGSDANGTLIAEADTSNITAGNTQDLTLAVTDAVGEVASQPYVVTVQQTGATGNGTVNHAYIVGFVD